MNSVNGWFSDNKEWIEYIVAVVVLWLLAMTAVSVFDLRSAGRHRIGHLLRNMEQKSVDGGSEVPS